jgi:hypothetical protein
MDIRAIAVTALALLVIGAGLGRNSVEPVVIEEHPTKTIVKEVEVPGPTETVYVDRFPDACLEAVRLANETNRRTIGALNLITPMTDALGMARAGVAGTNSEWLTESENQLRRIQSRMLNYLPQGDLGSNANVDTMKECKENLR